MSVKISTAVWNDGAFRSRTEKLVTLAIAEFSNDSGFAWPAVETIAARAMCTRRTLQRILSRLSEQGIIEVRNQSGPNGTNVYRVLIGGCQIEHGGVSLRAEGGVISDVGGRHSEQKAEGGGVIAVTPEPVPVQSNSTSTSIRSVKKALGQLPPIPFKLRTTEFKNEWGRWEKHRREIGHKLTPTAVSQQFRTLSEIGADEAILRIKQSIENGWQGLFPLRNGHVKAKKAGPDYEKGF